MLISDWWAVYIRIGITAGRHKRWSISLILIVKQNKVLLEIITVEKLDMMASYLATL